MLLNATCKAVLVNARPYDVHGQPNWVVLYRLGEEDPQIGDELEEAHLPDQSIYADPEAGDRILVDLVLGQAVAIRRA